MRMSTIISHNMKMGIPSITIYAPEARTLIVNTDINKHLIQIDGHAEKPFIHGVKFVDCVIVAENLRAFDSCYFDDSCTMTVKKMPIVNGYESINNNYVTKTTIGNIRMNQNQKKNADMLVEKHKGLEVPIYNDLPFGEYSKEQILAIIREAATRGSFLPMVYSK
jgi:hypothetical protein